jgi:hypothetical protein
MGKSPYDILRHMVEKIILPKHPTIQLSDVDSFFFSGRRYYDVRFITKKELDSETQEEIDSELKTLFKMASLDQPDGNYFNKNTIKSWFKTPRQKQYSFSSRQNYSH